MRGATNFRKCAKDYDRVRCATNSEECVKGE